MPSGIICCLDFSVVRVKNIIKNTVFRGQVQLPSQVKSKTPSQLEPVGEPLGLCHLKRRFFF